MDFSKVKSVTIPEGNAISVHHVKNGKSTLLWNANNTVLVSGSWQLNEVLELSPMNVQADILSHWWPESVTWGRYPFEECYSIVMTNEELRFEGFSVLDSLIYSVDSGFHTSINRVFSFNGEQLVSREFYDWLILNAVKVYDGMLSMLYGKWKFVSNPNTDELVPEGSDDRYDFCTGLSDFGGFASRRNASSEYYEYGIISVYRDSWDLPVIQYNGQPFSARQYKVYYAPGYEVYWQGEYWRTMDFGSGAFVDLEFFDWLVGMFTNPNAFLVDGEDSDVDL